MFAASLVALLSLGVTGTSSASPPGSGDNGSGAAGGSFGPGSGPNSCQLGNGIRHVVELTFDNVHFSRDNPDVPSDLEMLPNLLNFLEGNGTVLANNHPPSIAHTADDILTTLTGLYGDRQGMPIANDYNVFNPNGTTDTAGSFAYWTDPVYDTTTAPNPGSDANPNTVYSATPPATTTPAPAPDTTTPAPWVSAGAPSRPTCARQVLLSLPQRAQAAGGRLCSAAQRALRPAAGATAGQPAPLPAGQ